MNYRTTNELEHFDFSDAYIAEVQATSGFFHIILDNVTILPENSCNRDIRAMRTNQLRLKIENAVVESIVEEGYKVYDANGNLKEAVEDQEIAKENYFSVMKEFSGGLIYSLSKQETKYLFTIDAESERTYVLCVSGEGDVEEWDRFFNRESEY